jgi:agmatinase
LALIREIFASKKVIGMDIVELCPKVESKLSSFNAASLIAKCIGYESVVKKYKY